MKRCYSVPFLVSAAFAVSISAAQADQYPTLDVAPVCHGITQQSDLQEGFRDVTFDQCVKAEQEDREAMIKEWPTFLPSERTHCIAEATMGGESSYTDLVTCLEMARGVRLLKTQNKSNQSPAAPAQHHSKKTPHQQGGGS
jgi:hypothetical protein